jgi:membrane protein
LGALGKRLQAESSTLVAAGVAFFASLAVIPAMAIAVSVYGIFTNPQEAESHVDALLGVMPEATARALEAQIRPVADFSHFNLSLSLIVSVVALLWTVSNATRAMVRAVVIAYGQRHLRSPLETRLASIGLTVVVITVATAAVGVVAAIPIWLSVVDRTHALVNFANLRWGLIVILFGGGIALLYRFAPPTRPESWRAVLPGAVAATGLWLAISFGFSTYVSEFGRYNETYGALGAGAVLLLWFWLSSLVVILGAHFNALLAKPDVVVSG